MRKFALGISLGIALSSTMAQSEETCDCAGSWSTIESSKGNFAARHEADYVRVGEKFYLLGGRGNRALNIYDPKTDTWTSGTKPPKQIHHYQALAFEGEIWAIGAFTGKYPSETPYPEILVYNPGNDTWRTLHKPIPRPRGGGGLVAHNGKIYLVCGITNGHLDGHVAWLDCYDPKTETWTQLPDAPRARDHFRAVMVGDRIYNTAGRRSAAKSKQGVFGNTVAPVDYYDISEGKWFTLPETSNIPTPRAGNAAINYRGNVIVVGGESTAQKQAHAEVEALNPESGKWSTLAPMVRGRHGSGVVEYQDALYIASGSGNQGGAPELKTQEKFTPALPEKK